MSRGAGLAPPVTIVFGCIRGRARLRVAGLRGRPSVAHHLEERLSAEEGVHRVAASALTGNLLVLFDGDRLAVRGIVTMVIRCRATAPRASGISGRIDLAPSPDHPPWHAMPAHAVVEELDADARSGLTAAEAQSRLAAVGPNSLPVPEPRSGLTILLDQLSSLPVLLLGGAAVASIASGGLLDAAAILGVIAANAAIGFTTESRVERVLSSLTSSVLPTAMVRRDGRETVVPAQTLVPGDLVVLNAGLDVSADGRLVASEGLALNESLLTGEALPVAKDSASVQPEAAVVADRHNMAFSGTAVTEGSGMLVVTETGRRTELGRIRTLVGENTMPSTPLERELGALGRRLALASLAVCGGLFVLGVWRGLGALAMFRSVASLAVAAVPEGLPTVATTTLALGMRRMAERGALVRRLAVVESLGATTVICADKTGTVTENRMSVGRWHVGDRDIAAFLAGPRAATGDGAPTPLDPALERALAIGVLCSEAEVDRSGRGEVTIKGSPTEGALLLAARAAGVDDQGLRHSHPVLAMHPRGEGRNWMATVHARPGGGAVLVAKGAPEELLGRSSHVLANGGPEPADLGSRRRILAANARMADAGMRVLGLAYREFPAGDAPCADDLVWGGLVGLVDPVRPGVRAAIAACRRAGIRTVLITGDQGRTAVAVGRELGLARNGHLRVLEASELAAMNEDVLRGVVREVDIFARVAPAHKYRIVRALQANGEVVAMTGDGINDGPALKAADAGLAMGARGTDLARDLADVVLLDDDFGSIVAAVKQGRTIHANIRKALRFLLSTNLSELLVTAAATAAGGYQPLAPLHLLWVNLLTDVLPALALGVEPAERDVMRRAPHGADESILSSRAMASISTAGAAIAGLGLGAYGLGLRWYGPGPATSTLTLTTLVSSQLAYAIACRSEAGPGLRGLPQNPALIAALGGTLALQAGAVLASPLRAVLGTAALDSRGWAVVAAGGLASLGAGEAIKSALGSGARGRSRRG
jgi:P-type Ca2+ transporter type 2C